MVDGDETEDGTLIALFDKHTLHIMEKIGAYFFSKQETPLSSGLIE